ncbi:hypothetical protein ACKKBG_A01010 [Auxenochlorella protothecoides x Auxenochlorella symbiontica]
MPEITIEEVEGDAAQAVDLLSDSHWRDLAPLPYPPLPQPVVEIDMDEETALLMGRFWAVKTAGELSERALALTEHIILHINGAHYTVWEWRWRCVLALRGKEAGDVEESGSPPGVADTTPWPSASGFPTAVPAPALEAERELHAAVAAANPKNYQLWNARRRAAAAAGAGALALELAFTGACLALDAKNYHAWSHRQAVVAAAWEESVARAELEATRQLLGEDPRNNSAWSYRMYLVRALAADLAGVDRRAGGGGPLEGGATVDPGSPLIAIEMDLVRHAVHAVPSSQSAWAYALGLRPLVPAGALNQGIAELARQVLGAAPWSLAALRALRRAEGP